MMSVAVTSFCSPHDVRRRRPCQAGSVEILRTPWSRCAGWSVAAGALMLASGVILLARRAADFATFGDTAVIESYTWMASTGDLLLGPYSRFQWHHPGPVAFFWIAPFYVLSGARPAGLNAGALALNLAVLAIMTSIVIRRAGQHSRHRACWRRSRFIRGAWRRF